MPWSRKVVAVKPAPSYSRPSRPTGNRSGRSATSLPAKLIATPISQQISGRCPPPEFSIVAIPSFQAVVTVSPLIVRVATVALSLIGLSHNPSDSRRGPRSSGRASRRRGPKRSSCIRSGDGSPCCSIAVARSSAISTNRPRGSKWPLVIWTACISRKLSGRQRHNQNRPRLKLLRPESLLLAHEDLGLAPLLLSCAVDSIRQRQQQGVLDVYHDS